MKYQLIIGKLQGNYFFSLKNYSGHRIAIVDCLFIIRLIDSLIYSLIQYSCLLKIRVGLSVSQRRIYRYNMLFLSDLSNRYGHR